MADIDSTMVGALLAIMGEQGKKAFEIDAWKHRDTDIKYDGKEITLPGIPGPMPLEAAIAALQQKLADENQIMTVSEMITGYPFDAAVAFVKAMKETYGWSSPVPTPGFFGPKPPQLLTVKTGPEHTDTIQVPIGSYKIPGIENLITVQIQPQGFYVGGKCRKREKAVIMDLVALSKKIMDRESIYRGKALSLTVDEQGQLNRNMEPTFLHTKHVRPEELIMSKVVADLIETSIFTPIRHTDECLKAGIPLKRGVLLEGPYGTGKSMTASIASKVCVENGWTFIIIDKVQGLKEALLFARQYQPALVFAEDVDQVAETRDDASSDLLNTIDGVLNKDARVITVLTTNFVERIDRAMMRPGRLDAVISVTPPDAEAAIRLVHLYARNKLKSDEPLNTLGQKLEGHIPSSIREVVERSKLSMISHGRKLLTEDDLLLQAEGMKRHLELLNRPTGERRSVGDRLGDALRGVITGFEQTDLESVGAGVSNAADAAIQARNNAARVIEMLEELGDKPTPNGGIDPNVFSGLVKTVKEIHQHLDID